MEKEGVWEPDNGGTQLPLWPANVPLAAPDSGAHPEYTGNGSPLAAARKAKGQWPGGLVQGLVRFRWEQECLEPFAADLLKGVDAFLAGSAPAAAPDIWQARSLTLEAGAAARPVRLAIWDTGVDLSLFKAAPGASFAFNGDGAITEGPLLKDVKGDDAALVQWLQGRADFLAGLPTPAADAYAAHVKALSAKEVEAFQQAPAIHRKRQPWNSNRLRRA